MQLALFVTVYFWNFCHVIQVQIGNFTVYTLKQIGYRKLFWYWSVSFCNFGGWGKSAGLALNWGISVLTLICLKVMDFFKNLLLRAFKLHTSVLWFNIKCLKCRLMREDLKNGMDGTLLLQHFVFLLKEQFVSSNF